jgi:hypothetical protein
MRNWVFTLVVVAVSGGLPGPAASEVWKPGRDLEGLWTNASLTTLERPPAFKALVVPDLEAEAFESAHSGRPNLPFADDVGQGDVEWWEMGSGLARIDGQARSSWIVEPENGRLPLNEAGLNRVRDRQAGVLRDYDGPEARPSPERCLTATSGVAAPPMLNTSYNNHLQIVQTRDHVVLVAEMNHDARIIALKGEGAPVGLSWYGHPTARWEGRTLVVESTGFRPETSWRFPSRLYISPAARVTEEFTRISAEEIRYAFTVDDPTTYTRPWRGEVQLRRTKGPMFEFACHEGNYSIAGALAGARQAERDAATVRTAAPIGR